MKKVFEDQVGKDILDRFIENTLEYRGATTIIEKVRLRPKVLTNGWLTLH
jgi:hypothetical protein